jgi:outer membrane protein assembly factor BamB
VSWNRPARVLVVYGLVGLLGTSSTLRSADWPQFRGPEGTGVSADAGPPSDWDGASGENIRWRAELPGRGVSSPVVSGNRVYITAASGVRQERLHVLSFDRDTGKKLWERQFRATGNTLCHSKTGMAAPTPAADGDSVFALFGTGDLAALDRDGSLLWYRALARDYPQITNQLGMAASPVLAGDALLLAVETPGESFAAGLDKETGINLWKVPRPRDSNWVTPLVLRGRKEAVFVSAELVTAYDVARGRECWTYRAPGLAPTPSVPSPVQAGDLIVTANGVALRPGKTEPALVWKSNKLRPAYATPLFYGGRLYVVSNTGTILDCFDPKDGKLVWQQRLKGPFSASPVAAQDKVYLVNEEGLTTILEAGPRPHVLATNPLSEQVLATPAIAGNALFVRSDHHLFCIASQQ